MESQTQPNTNTLSYKEILRGIGQQLSLRKKDLLKRILLISWPLILFSGFVYLADKNSSLNNFMHTDAKLFFSIFAIAILFIIPYYFFTSFLFNIEKHLWIDASFDKRSMDSKTSWRISWKLLFPVFGLAMQTIVRYYIPSILATALGFWCIAYLTLHTNIVDLIGGINTLSIVCIVLVLLVVIYFYFLKIHLRYIFFIFIDRYNKDTFTYQSIFREMRELNKISKGESFRKALVVSFGTDVVSSISLSVLNSIQAGFNSLGNAGGFLGAVSKPLAEESVRQIKSYSQLTAVYMLYVQARTIANPNEPQEINKYIYTL